MWNFLRGLMEKRQGSQWMGDKLMEILSRLLLLYQLEEDHPQGHMEQGGLEDIHLQEEEPSVEEEEEGSLLHDEEDIVEEVHHVEEVFHGLVPDLGHALDQGLEEEREVILPLGLVHQQRGGEAHLQAGVEVGHIVGLVLLEANLGLLQGNSTIQYSRFSLFQQGTMAN